MYKSACIIGDDVIPSDFRIIISEHESEGDDRAERGPVPGPAAPPAGRPGHPGRGRRAARQAGVAQRAPPPGERRRGE